MKSPREAILRVIRAATPNPPMEVDEWLEKRQGVILPERGNAFPGLVNLSWTPYLCLPLKLFTDRTIERLGCCFGRQLGKTTYLFVIFGYIIDYDPGPTLLYYPTEDMGKKISKDRVMPTIENTPTLRRHMTGRMQDFQTLSYTFDRLTVRYAHAGSEVGGRSQPVRYLIKDETSAMTPSASSNADDTTTSFWNRRIIETSTPMNVNDNMWRFLGLEPKEGMKGDALWNVDAYEPKSATTVFFYFVPCPHCRKKIILHWRQIRWPRDCAIRDISKYGYYECQECGGKIENHHKTWMLDPCNGAEWLPHESQRHAPIGKWVGFHLSQLYGPWDSCGFGEIAGKAVRARSKKDPDLIARFVNNSLALPYSLEQEAIDVIDEEAIEKSVVTYSRNTIPKDVRILSIGIDVGQQTGSRVHWIVQGFGSKSRSWRISWGIVDDLYQMEQYIRKTVFQHPTAGQMVIYLGAADSRWNKPEVLRFCKLFRHRIFPIQGDRTIRPDPGHVTALPHKAYFPERDDKGRALPNSMLGYRINTVYWKQWLYGRINCTGGGDPTFYFPQERDATLEKHLRSEEEIQTRNKKTNRIERAWIVKRGYDANHYLDATIYGIAIADVFGLLVHPDDGKIYTGIKKKIQKNDQATANPMGFRKQNF